LRGTTVEEARRAALEQLVPAAVRSLENHLGDGDPAAWRAAIRVLELFYGRGTETAVDITLPVDFDGMAALSWDELRILACRVAGELAPSEPEIAAASIMPGTYTQNAFDQ